MESTIPSFKKKKKKIIINIKNDLQETGIVNDIRTFTVQLSEKG